MARKALIVWGGWKGHTPERCAKIFARELQAAGYEVTIENNLDAYLDRKLMGSLSVVLPVWTMGQIKDAQWHGLDAAVRSGVGCAGFHGGFVDAFRNHTEYQWMTGGQFVAHPGNCLERYTVDITDRDHDITRGLDDFELTHTEQYYVHLDPANHVLATTTFSGSHGDRSLYRSGTVMPYAWTKTWGAGRVFAACWGHSDKDFEVPEARELVRRGLLWASR